MPTLTGSLQEELYSGEGDSPRTVSTSGNFGFHDEDVSFPFFTGLDYTEKPPGLERWRLDCGQNLTVTSAMRDAFPFDPFRIPIRYRAVIGVRVGHGLIPG